MTLGQPIVAEVVQAAQSAVPTATQLLQSAYKAMNQHWMLTGAISAPLAAYGFLTGRRLALWAGAVGIAVAAYQYRQSATLNQQLSVLSAQQILQGR